MTGALWALFAYAAALVALGAWIGRRVRDSGSFFVANRKLGPGLLLVTVLAANLGAGTTVGAAGLGYRDGLSAWWWVGSAGIGTILLAVWAGPRLRRAAARHGLLTMGDYLELRYGRSVRLLIAVLLWFATLTIVSGQLIAMAEIVSVVAGAPRWVGALVGGVVVMAYFAAGGLVASAWVNLVQLVVLAAGMAIAIPWALAGVGGWEAVEAAAAGAGSDYLNPWRGGASGWVYAPLLAPAFIISPGLVQKVYGAVDGRAVRVGLLAAGAALLLFALAPTLLGMIARAYDPALARGEQALPMLFASALPPALGMLGLAAVFSAEVSSADAGLFMLSTSLSRDLYKGFLRPAATDRQVLRAARAAALAGGALSVVLALWLESVIASLTIFYSVLSVSLFVPVAAGLHSRRAGTPEALAAVGAGLAALGAVRLWAPEDAPPLLDAALVGLVVSAAAFALARLLRRRRGGRGIVAGCALAWAAGGCGGEGRTLSIATGNTNGLYYPLGGGLASIWSRHVDGVNMKAETTAGSVTNLIQVAKGESEVGFSQADALAAALAGAGRFPEPLALSALGRVYPNVVHLVTIRSTGIASVQDLRGRRVSVGPPGSGNAVTAWNVLGAMGIGESDITVRQLNYAQMANGLKDGTLDAGFIAGGVGMPAVVEIGVSRDMVLVPFAQEEIEAIASAESAYTAFTMPPGVYRGVDEPVLTPTLWNLLVVAQSMDDDLAYDLTRAMMERRSELERISGVARFITPASAIEVGAFPLHPGARRYYDEAGFPAGGR